MSAEADVLPLCEAPVPANFGVIGLIDNAWSVHLSDKDTGSWIPISTDQEVRTFEYSTAQQTLLYAAEDGSIRSRDLDKGLEHELAGTDQHLRQPLLIPSDRRFNAVQFDSGSSGNTNIVLFDDKFPDAPSLLVTQPGAVFSPALGREGQTLLYTVAHCVEGCGRIIQEVWRKDLESGRAEQLTLIGGMSSDPVDGHRPDIVYFSLIDEEGESIVRFDPERGAITRRYRVGQRNRQPAVNETGQLHFLTEIEGRAVIARFDDDKGGCHYPLPETFIDARELVRGS